jgi:hypothetical protein
MFYATHWAACIYYLMARLNHFAPNTYVGRNIGRFEGKSVAEKYLLSLYMAVTIFVGKWLAAHLFHRVV